MRIALVSPYDISLPGGVNKHILNMSRVFTQAGHHACIIAPVSAPGRMPASGVFSAGGCVVPIQVNGSLARLSLAPVAGKRIRRLLREGGFDVLHIHEPANPTLPWLVLNLVSRQSPRPLLAGTFHAARETADLSPAWRLLTRAAQPVIGHWVAQLDARIAVSAVAREHAERLVAGFYRIVPNGVDVSLFAGDRGRPAIPAGEGPAILFVGRLEPRKGYRLLLQAFGRLLARIPDARLVMVGPCSPRQCGRIRDELGPGAAARTVFAGQVPEAELPRYYRACQVFCAPSQGCESFGMVLLEAMAAGAPIVASDIPGYRQVMQDGREGRLVPAGDPLVWADTLEEMLRQPARREAMGIQGRRTAAAYDWRHVASQVMGVYEDARKPTALAHQGHDTGHRQSAAADTFGGICSQTMHDGAAEGF